LKTPSFGPHSEQKANKKKKKKEMKDKGGEESKNVGFFARGRGSKAENAPLVERRHHKIQKCPKTSNNTARMGAT